MRTFMLSKKLKAVVLANDKAHAARLLNRKILDELKRKRRPQEKAILAGDFTDITSAHGRAHILLGS